MTSHPPQYSGSSETKCHKIRKCAMLHSIFIHYTTLRFKGVLVQYVYLHTFQSLICEIHKITRTYIIGLGRGLYNKFLDLCSKTNNGSQPYSFIKIMKNMAKLPDIGRIQ